MKRHLLNWPLSAMFLMFLFVYEVDGQTPDGPPHTRSIQNLYRTPNGYFGHYLSLDNQDGELEMSQHKDLEHSESYWEIRVVRNSLKDYVKHTIRQRGNNRFNGQYLSLTSTEDGHQFGLTADRSANTQWLIRYAGLYRGFNSYYIQTVSGGENDTNFAYVGLDHETGKLDLYRKPVDETHWFLGDGPDLPSENIRLLKLY